MNAILSVSKKLYAIIIQLYPKKFHTEFGTEMEVTFGDLLSEMARTGNRSIISLWLRELIDLPINLLHEHWFTNKEITMQKKRLRSFGIITVLLFYVDWILGNGIASDHLPLWTFMIPNFPFGIAYVWFESRWTGAGYDVGRPINGDLIAMIIFFSIIVLQSGLYYILINQIKSPSVNAQSD